MLTSIPIWVASVIISQWLSFKNVAAVDAAMCKRREREVWLELLAANSTVLSKLPKLSGSNNWEDAMSWMVARKAKVHDCFISLCHAALCIPTFETFMTHIGNYLSYSEVDLFILPTLENHDALLIIAANIPQLKGLKINKIRCLRKGTELPQVHLLLIPCIHLHQLCLECDIDLTIAQAVAGMTNLLILQADCIEPGCLTIVANGCRRLRAVSIQRFHDDYIAEMEALVTSCADLTMLSLKDSKVDDALLHLMATHIDDRLKVLELGDNAKGSTPEGLLHLLRHCPNLHGLRIPGWHLFPSEQPDSILREIFGHCRQLRELDAWCSRNIHLWLLAGNCPELRYLTVDNCSASGRGLVYLLKQCPKLRTLVIGHDERDDLWHSACLVLLDECFPHVEVGWKSDLHLPIWEECLKKGLY